MVLGLIFKGGRNLGGGRGAPAGGAALAAGAGWQLHVSLAVAAGFAVNVFVLTPRINFYRDRDLDGDAAAKRIFGLLHLASVAIFLAQLAGSLAIVGMFIYAPF